MALVCYYLVIIVGSSSGSFRCRCGLVSRCRSGLVSRCRSGLVSGLGSMISGLGFILGVTRFSFISNGSNITIFVSGIAYNLNAAIGQGNSV
jgi:hypothetical protein